MQAETDSRDAETLHHRAEVLLTPDRDPAALSPDEIRRLFHELQVRQRELEMQNDELRRVQGERDITDLKWAEALDLYDNAPCGYHSLDADGNITTINQTELSWLGYEREELIGQPATRIFSPEGRFADAFARFKTAGSVTGLEFDFVRKDGTILPVALSATAAYDENGHFLASRSTAVDISDRKRAEEKLRFQAELLDMVGEALIATDMERLITYWNRAAEDLYGWTAAEAIGHSIFEKTGAEASRTQVEEIMAAVHARQKWSGEFVVRHRDGPRFWAQVTDAPVSDSSGQLIGVIGVSEDITTRRQAEETLRLANLEMQRALRLKDEFLASISHELRTPLSAVLGLSESLTEQIAGPLNDRQQRYVEIISESGNHLLELINSLLDLARISAGKMDLEMGPVDVGSVAEASLRMIRQQALKKRQQVALAIEHPRVQMMADGLRIRQILVNLLSNAVKFTPEGGQIGLEVRGDEQDRTMSFTVWDTGIGIAQDDLPRLFQPFVQLDTGLGRSREGSGLGLALVSEMAGLHGGSVSVESEPGTGSRFTISIPWLATPSGAWQGSAAPLSEAAQILPPELAAASLPPDARDPRARILLVDDSEVSQLVVRDYLRAHGYEVLTARDSLEGIAEATRYRPDIILMDVMMPGLDGIRATRSMRGVPELEDTPIIALTALVMQGDRERCLLAGMDDYLSKPVKLERLVQVIERHLALAPKRVSS